MEVLIYGAGNMGKVALELMKNEYKSNRKMVGFIDRNKSGQYCGYDIYKVEEIKDFTGRIVIALLDFQIAKNVCKMLKKSGFEDIFWFQHKKTILGYEDFYIEQCSDCREWGDAILQQAEMHIIDSCNLNCKGCAHFSPIFPDTLPDLNSRLRDVRQLKGKVSHIMDFYILGGEPFLNPEIDKYICAIREILPNTKLFIVTNGLLIEHLSEETLICIKANKVWLSITEYKPTKKKMGTICEIINKYKILYEIRGTFQNRKFNLPLSLSEHSIYPLKCISKGCVTIWNGKISRCPQLMYISYFNSYFDTNLPEAGVLELEDCAEGEELIQILNKDIPLCKHCIQNEIEWEVCGKNAKIEDFAVEE